MCHKQQATRNKQQQVTASKQPGPRGPEFNLESEGPGGPQTWVVGTPTTAPTTVHQTHKDWAPGFPWAPVACHFTAQNGPKGPLGSACSHIGQTPPKMTQNGVKPASVPCQQVRCTFHDTCADGTFLAMVRSISGLLWQPSRMEWTTALTPLIAAPSPPPPGPPNSPSTVECMKSERHPPPPPPPLCGLGHSETWKPPKVGGGGG